MLFIMLAGIVVDRRIGGLERGRLRPEEHEPVDRRKGGLEKP